MLSLSRIDVWCNLKCCVCTSSPLSRLLNLKLATGGSQEVDGAKHTANWAAVSSFCNDIGDKADAKLLSVTKC